MADERTDQRACPKFGLIRDETFDRLCFPSRSTEKLGEAQFPGFSDHLAGCDVCNERLSRFVDGLVKADREEAAM